MAPVRVAVCGTNGTLAPAVFKHLLASSFEVTALTRDASTTKLKAPIKVVQADYSSAAALAPFLKGHDAVVDLLNRNLWQTSMLIADAAIAAGVPFIVPSAFGLGWGVQTEAIADLPPLAGKRKMQEYVAARGAAGEISYAMVSTALLLDWALQIDAFIPKAGGNVYSWTGDLSGTATLLDDVGRAVATVIKKREDPSVKNKMLYAQSTTCSTKRMLEAARAADPSKKWTEVQLNPEAALKKAWDEYNAGSREPATMRVFIGAGAYGQGHSLFKQVDNDILGITELTDQEFEELVATYVNKGKDAPYPYYRG